MNQKNSNEITIKIKSKPNELYKILEEKGYKITKNSQWTTHISYPKKQN